MTGPLSGRKAIVTGGAQGIGAAIVRGFVAGGARVALIDRQADKARALSTELGGSVVAIGADLEAPGDCRAAVRAAAEAMGGLDVLVNNAAPGRDRGMIGKLGDTDWAGHESVVLHGAALLAEAALADLAASGRGAIVNVSSILGTEIGMDQSSLAYHVSKAGLDQFTRWLAVKGGASGVRVNAVAPGLVDRDGGQKLTDNPVNKKIVEAVVPLRRAASGAEVCAAVMFLASDAASYITGQVLRVDGGLGLHEVFGASLRAFNAARDPGKP
jgi:3-oxoacyl-[acyl-carrier protein] reductase